MSEITLSRDARLTLRAQAHHLNPVVLLGASGLTEAVMKEIDRELKAHEPSKSAYRQTTAKNAKRSSSR